MKQTFRGGKKLGPFDGMTDDASCMAAVLHVHVVDVAANMQVGATPTVFAFPNLIKETGFAFAFHGIVRPT